MNTQQDHELAEKIAILLNHGTTQIDAKTVAKLLEARKEALAHFQDKPAHGWVPKWAAASVGRLGGNFEPNLRAGLVILALLAFFAGAVALQTLTPQGSEIADVDEGLLTGELPINAYLDKGFNSWLKRP